MSLIRRTAEVHRVFNERSFILDGPGYTTEKQPGGRVQLHIRRKAAAAASVPGCCDLSLVSGIRALNVGMDLVSDCGCLRYERSTGNDWTVTTSNPPELGRFIFRCYDSTGHGNLVLDFLATSRAFGRDVTGRGVIVEVNDSDTYWINADIGYLGYAPFPPACGKIAVAPYATIGYFGGCDDTPGTGIYPDEIGAAYSPGELIGPHTFSKSLECIHHPGQFYVATWTITFS